MLPAEERLTQRRDFAAVYGGKRSWVHPLLVLYVRPHVGMTWGEDAETRRFGFSVSKKVGKAHDRNLVKRRLRAICRAHRREWRYGFDAVFVARSAAREASFAELEAAAGDLARRADLVAPACN
jgi:ribonuclease P protein component